ncbi:MAG: ABC transporter substrate-binding protein [bacterium]|nr:ABC transporter substrate-binding protein [bacterium]
MQQRKSIIWATLATVILFTLGGWWYLAERTSQTPTTIKIGALLPLTGKLAGYGEDVRNGIMLAQEELREREVTVEIVFEDSAGDPKVALSGTRKLIDIDKTPIVVGGPGSSAALAAAPLFEDGQTLFFPISNASKLNEAGRYIFKLQHDVEFEMPVMVAHLLQNEQKEVGVFYDSSSESNVAGANAFRAEFEKAGGRVVLFDGFDGKSTNDFRTRLTHLKTLSPEALYLVTPGSSGGVIVKQARELGLSTPAFGWSGLNGAEFFAGATVHADGVVITDQPFSCAGMESTYCKRYDRKYTGRTPEQYGAHSYDIMLFLVDAFEKLNIEGPEIDENEKAKLISYFTNRTLEGASGRLRFDTNGNLRDKDFVFRIAEDGKFVDLK